MLNVENSNEEKACLQQSHVLFPEIFICVSELRGKKKVNPKTTHYLIYNGISNHGRRNDT